MKISIITPSLNQGQFLEQNLISVKNQEDCEVEHIVIDGGSIDDSVSILKDYDQYLAYWLTEIDSGQSDAINKGIRKSTGTVLNWLNSDDFYEPNSLSRVRMIFDSPGVTCFCGISKKFDEEGTVTFTSGTDIYPLNLAKTIGWARIDQPETFFRREVWEKVGLLNEDLHYTMDREWWMRYLYHYGLQGIIKQNDVLVNFRLHNDSKTVSESDKFQIEHSTLFYIMSQRASSSRIKTLIADFNEINDSISSDLEKWTNQELIDRSLNYFLLRKADEAYYQNDMEAAKSYLSEIKPTWLETDDRKLYSFLKIKSRLPLSLIHLFRK